MEGDYTDPNEVFKTQTMVFLEASAPRSPYLTVAIASIFISAGISLKEEVSE